MSDAKNSSLGASESSIKSPIKVFCRVKPMTGAYSEYLVCSDPNICEEQVNNTDLLHIFPKQIIFPSGIQVNDYKNSEPLAFGFAKVFDHDSTQEDVFNLVASPIIESVLDGFNGTIFAYGQTGTGKTFTMTGRDAEFRGLIPRAIYYIFQKIGDCNGNTITSLAVSYMEIYNEEIYDLLGSTVPLKEFGDFRKIKFTNSDLRNLSKYSLNSEKEACRFLELGNANRATAETSLNQASTRSHCIFTIYISGIRELSGDEPMVTFSSKLHLVDLAGSERIAKYTALEQSLNESKNINLSLTFLEQVVVALNEPDRKHIPYRNSMLTNVLKDTLGGNSLTTFLATVSLDQNSIKETLTTCRFMQRVGQVKNPACRTEYSVRFKEEVEYIDANDGSKCQTLDGTTQTVNDENQSTFPMARTANEDGIYYPSRLPEQADAMCQTLDVTSSDTQNTQTTFTIAKTETKDAMCATLPPPKLIDANIQTVSGMVRSMVTQTEIKGEICSTLQPLILIGKASQTMGWTNWTSKAEDKKTQTENDLVEVKDDIIAATERFSIAEVKLLVKGLLDNFMETSDAMSIVAASVRLQDLRILQYALLSLGTQICEEKAEIYLKTDEIEELNNLIKQYESCPKCANCTHNQHPQHRFISQTSVQSTRPQNNNRLMPRRVFSLWSIFRAILVVVAFCPKILIKSCVALHGFLFRKNRTQAQTQRQPQQMQN